MAAGLLRLLAAHGAVKPSFSAKHTGRSSGLGTGAIGASPISCKVFWDWSAPRCGSCQAMAPLQPRKTPIEAERPGCPKAVRARPKCHECIMLGTLLDLLLKTSSRISRPMSESGGGVLRAPLLALLVPIAILLLAKRWVAGVLAVADTEFRRLNVCRRGALPLARRARFIACSEKGADWGLRDGGSGRWPRMAARATEATVSAGDVGNGNRRGCRKR